MAIRPDGAVEQAVRDAALRALASTTLQVKPVRQRISAARSTGDQSGRARRRRPLCSCAPARPPRSNLDSSGWVCWRSNPATLIVGLWASSTSCRKLTQNRLRPINNDTLWMCFVLLFELSETPSRRPMPDQSLGDPAGARFCSDPPRTIWCRRRPTLTAPTMPAYLVYFGLDIDGPVAQRASFTGHRAPGDVGRAPSSRRPSAPTSKRRVGSFSAAQMCPIRLNTCTSGCS